METSPKSDTLECLERFVYDNPDLEQLEALLDDFNPFVALRWTRQEIRHSAFLRWILDPSETHGLGTYFLRLFLKRLARESQPPSDATPSVFDMDGWALTRTQVLQEWQSIDVLVRDDSSGLVAVVENKIDTSEHSQQLQRYRELVEAQFPGHKRLFCFLTVGGDLPSDDAYVPIGHGDIADLLQETLRRRGDQLASEVRSFLEHYVEMVRRHIVEDSQIQEICRQIYENHKRALDVLFEHRPDRVSEISDFIVGLIEEVDHLTLDSSSKSYIRFLPTDLDFIPRAAESWTTSKRILLFQIELVSSLVAIKLYLGPGDETIRNKVHAAVVSEPELFNRAKQRLYPKWWSCHSERWITARQFEEMELEDLQALIKERFDQFSTENLPAMTETLVAFSEEFAAE